MPDRRRYTLHALIRGNIRPRRRGPRRAAERTAVPADRSGFRWVAIGALILCLSIADGLLTLRLLDRGAYELNPLMAALLEHGPPWAFAVAKIGLTVAGVAVLTGIAHLRAFGGIRVTAILGSVLALYVTLVIYELGLLGTLAASG